MENEIQLKKVGVAKEKQNKVEQHKSKFPLSNCKTLGIVDAIILKPQQTTNFYCPYSAALTPHKVIEQYSEMYYLKLPCVYLIFFFKLHVLKLSERIRKTKPTEQQKVC